MPPDQKKTKIDQILKQLQLPITVIAKVLTTRDKKLDYKKTDAGSDTMFQILEQ